MSVELDPQRKNAAYKWFVENLSDGAQSSILANRIRKNGHAERKRIVLNLTSEELEALARMLERERMAAYHDVAAFLEGWLSNGLKMAFKGDPIPASPYWSMHYDLIAVAAGDGWEDEQ